MKLGNKAINKAHLQALYLYRHGHLANLERPRLFTEFVQHRKLFDRDPRQVALMDKLAAKDFASRILGKESVTPTLWSAEKLPDKPPFEFPLMLKARHGCNQYRALHTAPMVHDYRRLQKLGAKWCQRPYGALLGEWAYKDVERGLITEALLQPLDGLPIDYKIYVFGGQATRVQVHINRASSHKWVIHDRAFRPLASNASRLTAPRSLCEMLKAAEALSQNMPFVRVDFYEIEGQARFGEFCLYPGSGLVPFPEKWIDHELGSLWAREIECAQLKMQGRDLVTSSPHRLI